MASRTIVVIEDDPILRADTVDMLAAAGLNVVAFENGDDALAFIREHHDDVAGIFTDVRLATDTSGLDIARLVTEAFPGIAVVVTSGQLTEAPLGLGRVDGFWKGALLGIPMVGDR